MREERRVEVEGGERERQRIGGRKRQNGGGEQIGVDYFGGKEENFPGQILLTNCESTVVFKP